MATLHIADSLFKRLRELASLNHRTPEAELESLLRHPANGDRASLQEIEERTRQNLSEQTIYLTQEELSAILREGRK